MIGNVVRVSVIALLLPLSWAPAQQMPPVPEGTGSITGHVTATDTGKPIRGAVVEIVIYNNTGSRFPRVTTDAEGKFTFTKLPAGQYQIASQAARYIRLQYGQQQPGPAGLLNPPRIIELTEGQSFANADFALSSFGAIEGTIVDEFGDPVPNAAVQVSQVQYAGGRRRLVPASRSADVGPVGLTDDQGRFRAGGLAPGDYYVEALSGAFADPNAAGGFAVTFFPGTSKPSAAQAVSVRPGADAPNVSFALTPAVMARVAGTLVDGTGRPLAGKDLMLMPSETTGSALVMLARSVADANGRFTFRNVPPGTYTIQAFGAPAGDGGNLGAMAFGYQTFTVDGRDLDSLTVTVPAPRTLRGHITFDGDMALLPKTTDEVSVSTRPVNFESAPMSGGPAPTKIRDDWTFEISAMSGLRVVIVGSRQGWTMKRATLNGRDVTDVPLDLREADVNGLEVVLTTRTSTVTGTIVDASEKPLRDHSVVIFADDETKWTVWSRFVTFSRSGQQGTFTVKGLPAGSYIAVGVQATANGEWQDPDYLKKLRASGDAVRFALSDEGSATVKVTVRK
jgi:protocatechuate 3,4-dioxygenase beta subunit